MTYRKIKSITPNGMLQRLYVSFVSPLGGNACKNRKDVRRTNESSKGAARKKEELVGRVTERRSQFC